MEVLKPKWSLRQWGLREGRKSSNYWIFLIFPHWNIFNCLMIKIISTCQMFVSHEKKQQWLSDWSDCVFSFSNSAFFIGSAFQLLEFLSKLHPTKKCGMRGQQPGGSYQDCRKLFGQTGLESAVLELQTQLTIICLLYPPCRASRRSLVRSPATLMATKIGVVYSYKSSNWKGHK